MQRVYQVRGHRVQIDYRPRLVRRNMITSVDVDLNPLYQELRNSYFQITGTTVTIHNRVWDLTNLIFDVIREVRTTDGEHRLAFHIADYLFNRFGGIWGSLFQRSLLLASANLWIQVCNKIWEWEDSNEPIKVHKGTPYYFLAFTLMNLGNLDLSFTFIFNAIGQDKTAYSGTTSPGRYKESPAYRLATLVDRKDNTFYHFIKDAKTWLLEKAKSYRKYTHVRFRYSDFESRFLRETQLEETVYFFVYEILHILSQERFTPKRVRKNEFSKLRNLNTMFSLCLIVDKVLEFKYRALPASQRDSLGKNIFNIFRERGWLIGESHAGDLKSEFTRSGTDLNDAPDTIVPSILANNVRFHGSTIREEMAPLLLVWHLRNYGGHKIKTQQVLVDEYTEIVDFILYSLFFVLS